MISRHPRIRFILIALCLMWFEAAMGQANTRTLINRTASVSNVVRLQDYDADGDLDMVITALDPTPGVQNTDTLMWLENDPSQLFPKHIIVDEDLDSPVDIDIADMDNDGDMDYVVCSWGIGLYTADGELAAYQRQPDGSYVKWTIEASEDFRQADLGDFDGDGNMDVIAVGLDKDVVTVYFNDGFWDFEQKIVADSILRKDTIEAEDIDGDGDVDFVTDGKVYMNDGNANFTPVDELPVYLGFRASAYGISVTDLNNDGIKDILTFSDKASAGLYWFDGANGFAAQELDNDRQRAPGSDNGGEIQVFDIDGNGLKDIIRQNFVDDRIIVLYQRSNMVFEKEVLEYFWNNNAGRAFTDVGDIDGDGDLDYAFVSNSGIDPKIAWYENIEGKLYRHLIYGSLSGIQDIETGDIDNDGDEDILVSLALNIAANHEILLYENLGRRSIPQLALNR